MVELNKLLLLFLKIIFLQWLNNFFYGILAFSKLLTLIRVDSDY